MGKTLLAFALPIILLLLFTGCSLLDEGNVSTNWTPTIAPTIMATPTAVLECPDCDDGNSCTEDVCDRTTGFRCAHSELSGPQPGCSGVEGCFARGCQFGDCILLETTPCCGNRACEEGEGCTSCTGDCPCAELCCDDVCRGAECMQDFDCNDNEPCTRDSCLSPGGCEAQCVNAEKQCLHADLCCPSGCDFLTDNDCANYRKGNTVNTSQGLRITVIELFRWTCTSGTIQQYWLAAKLNVENIGDSPAYFAPSNMTVIDFNVPERLGEARQYTYNSSVPGISTDCYARDRDFLLSAGMLASGEEKNGYFVYFSTGNYQAVGSDKRIVINVSEGGVIERYVFLISPVG